MGKGEIQSCMKNFKASIAALMVLIVGVVAWTAWHCGGGPRREFELALAAAATPTAPPIDVKAKMLHPYWGNCDMCHLTTGAGKPVSQVMAGPPIIVSAQMTHDYWGNCQLCHKVTGGVQPAGNTGQVTAKAAALNRITSQTLGLRVQTVTAGLKQQYGLFSEDGVLILEVQPNSIAFQTGLQKGDEVLRVNKTRVESVNSFESSLSDLKPGSSVPINIYRGKKRNLFMKIPEAFPVGLPSNTTPGPSPGPNLVATMPPMTQNQIETMAEQLGVPKTQQSVAQALQGTVPGNASLAAAVPPMTQNQIETLAEQLGVPKTQQSVAQALQRNSGANRNQAAPAAPPMTQNQIETLAEQLGVPKNQQSVAQALQKQSRSSTQLAVANLNFGKVAVGAMGPGLNTQVSTQFAGSPYFIVFDPAQNTTSCVANPNFHSAAGQDVQTGQYMVDLGVSNVISGSFTPDAVNTLKTLRVTVYPGVTGSVRNVLSAYAAGQLSPMNMNPGVQPGAPRQAPFSNGVRQNGQTLF